MVSGTAVATAMLIAQQRPESDAHCIASKMNKWKQPMKNHVVGRASVP